MRKTNMTNADLLNKLLNKYNAKEGMKLLKDELGPDRVQYEMEKYGFDKLTKDHFLDILKDWAFFEDYITDENWEIYNPYK